MCFADAPASPHSGSGADAASDPRRRPRRRLEARLPERPGAAMIAVLDSGPRPTPLPPAPPPMTRSILVVVGAFLLVGALIVGTTTAVTGAAPQYFGEGGSTRHAGVLLLMQLYVFVYATLGCWLAARLAPSKPMRHAMVVGWLGLAYNVVGTYFAWGLYPAWSNVLGLLLVMPAAYLGGLLAARPRAAALASA
jgi:hypothetical protein